MYLAYKNVEDAYSTKSNPLHHYYITCFTTVDITYVAQQSVTIYSTKGLLSIILNNAIPIVVVVVVLALYESITTRRKYKRTSSIDCREVNIHFTDSTQIDCWKN